MPFASQHRVGADSDELRFSVQSDEVSTRTIAFLLQSETISEQQLSGITEPYFEAADEHGVRALLAYRLLLSWPQSDGVGRQQLQRQIAAETARDLLRAKELSVVTARLHAANVPVLVLKGAALAYSHYPLPGLRPRLDTDLLVSPSTREPAMAAVREMGYEPIPTTSGDAVTHQAQYARYTSGFRHVIDLHWKTMNPQAFADLLPFEALSAEAQPVPGFEPFVRAPKPVHMLLHLLLHRVAHHEPSANLLVLHDLHVVASRLSADEWGELTKVARSADLLEISAQGLAMAADYFATPMPPDVVGWVARFAGAPVPRRFAPFLKPGRRLVDVIAADLAEAGWRARWRLVREHLFPPVAYMKARYGTPTTAWLPMLYAHRLIAGVPRMLRRDRYR